MVSEQQYRWLADQVYSVDNQKNNGQYKSISKKTYYYDRNNPELGQFQVLKAKDNLDNGMQAMAVVPIVDGEPDISQIVIAYAEPHFSRGIHF
ncbi:hypothetical protein [Streptococcus pantholopis]|uniref:Uncharacterized protein n=1 Tax=Streptococcus pantholopis TaxID=1811193 RepID=A0A172Q9L0_9STRE|nr:hypothetical protein [Streptococcus pantholopis]AND80144.1 hypothetical protein A0O21_09095 [Streptococcus pantholopis]